MYHIHHFSLDQFSSAKLGTSWDISEGEGADLGNNLYTITFPKPANSMTGVTFDGAPQLQDAERCKPCVFAVVTGLYVSNMDG